MHRKRKPKNTAGVLAVLVVLAVDAVLAVWLWQWRRDRVAQEELALETGRPLAPVAGEAEPMLAPPPLEGELVVAPGSPVGRAPALVLPASRLPAPLPTASLAAGGPKHAAQAAGAKALASIDPKARRDLPAAERAYRALKTKPRYRALAKAWTEEFARHADLRAINHQYHKDRDALRFILSAVRSPNFLRMLGSFASRSDLQGFIRELARTPAVSDTARHLVEDRGVMAAVDKVPVAGLGTIGALAEAGKRGRAGQEELIKTMLQSNPDLKRALERR